MSNIVLIEALDDYGRGIAHINGKIVFVDKTLPNDYVEIKIINEKKKYIESEVIKYLEKSKLRITSSCPHFTKCGGCCLLNMKYEDTLEFKQLKISNLLKKYKIPYNKPLEIISNPNDFNYRNKISLKIINGKIGYYEEKTHQLVEINYCLVAQKAINEVIKNYQLLNLINAKLTIRSNYNDEILLIIESSNKDYNIEVNELKNKIKLVGIVYNNKTIYGQNFFYERINNKLFKVSYNSFFQVNPYITSLIFKELENQLINQNNILDLYCGVGTLSITAASKANKVYGIEIVKNAILNGLTNAKLNKVNNVEFFLGDVSKIVDKIKVNIDTIIVDPPRKGLDKKTINYILEKKSQQIIYISCNPLTLMRDLQFLTSKYDISICKIFDMFSYSYHVECVCLLNLR